MSLIRFKAKVRLSPEQDMELEAMDLNIASKNSYFDITDVALPSEYISKIIKHSPKITLIYTSEYDGQQEKLLVYEKFDKVYEKWQNAIGDEEDLILGGEEE